jgi:hypothetical protein
MAKVVFIDENVDLFGSVIGAWANGGDRLT